MRSRQFWTSALAAVLLGAMASAAEPGPATHEVPEWWQTAWPRTDFSRLAVPPGEIISGGPPRDGIPAIDRPKFMPVNTIRDIKDSEPVIALEIAGDARAYPIRIMLWHEIVNDEVGGVPVTVTYCPLCNSAVVFDRRLDGRTLDFGVSGLLRHSDMVMYDRQTESWWQQYLGEAIVGELRGSRLASIPARVEAFARFRQRFPAGHVLVPVDASRRPYGRNPYVGYDTEAWPMLFKGDYDGPIPPLARVVAVGEDAWPLDLLRRRGSIEHGDLLLTWTPGQHSPLDAAEVAQGRDVGNVVVRRRSDAGYEEVTHDVPFAFAFRAFRPNGRFHVD